ncbi:phage tail protein [Salmonella enterica subsp. enterica]|nr:phage tail protein [Salmonella enterica subsp. enterica serovar Give]EDT7406337.1 phage tail protein [Salmonella enterica subsp. enterica]
MHRIDTPTAQKDKFGQGKNGFTNGDPATGRRATDLNSDMWDAVQEEVCTVIEAAGIQLSKGEHTQLHAAIGRLIDEQVKTRLEKNQNGADIPNKPLFLQNVGLTETVEQARNAVPSTRKVNGKALTTDITLTSGDIGALPVTGGKLNGPLGIGTDNALGGNSIVFGDNDTGIKQDGDGILGIYANNARVGYIDNSGLHMLNDVYSGDAHLGGNGDIFGSVWGGWLNDFLNNNYNRKNTASLGDYGWVRDESTGFIMQWGTLGSSNGTYNFPREFPASCFAVFVTNTSQQGGAVDNAFGYPVSKSQFFAATKASTDGNVVNNYPVAWFAIGR